MRKQLMIPALLAMSVALAACSTPPNANLENARTNFSALPVSYTHLTLPTKRIV